MPMMQRLSKWAIPLHATSEHVIQSDRLRERRPRQPDLPFDPMPQRIEPCLVGLEGIIAKQRHKPD